MLVLRRRRSRDYIFSDSTWKQRDNKHRPYYLPLVRRHANGYLHQVFCSCGFNSAAERVSQRGKAREEAQWIYRRSRRRGGSCASHQRSEKKNGLQARIRCRKAKAGGKKTEESLVLYRIKWSYPPRESTSLRWRASRRSAAERFVTRALKDSLFNDCI